MLILSGFSQTTYPIAQVIGNDTNIIITPSQLKYANRQVAKVTFLINRTITLVKSIEELNKTLKFDSIIIAEKENKIVNYNISTTNYTSIIELKDKTIAYNLKIAKKEKRKAIITSGIVGIIGGLIISIF